jgi:hypothetical protein
MLLAPLPSPAISYVESFRRPQFLKRCVHFFADEYHSAVLVWHRVPGIRHCGKFDMFIPSRQVGKVVHKGSAAPQDDCDVAGPITGPPEPVIVMSAPGCRQESISHSDVSQTTLQW